MLVILQAIVVAADADDLEEARAMSTLRTFKGKCIKFKDFNKREAVIRIIQSHGQAKISQRVLQEVGLHMFFGNGKIDKGTDTDDIPFSCCPHVCSSKSVEECSPGDGPGKESKSVEECYPGDGPGKESKSVEECYPGEGPGESKSVEECYPGDGRGESKSVEECYPGDGPGESKSVEECYPGDGPGESKSVECPPGDGPEKECCSEEATRGEDKPGHAKFFRCSPIPEEDQGKTC